MKNKKAAFFALLCALVMLGAAASLPLVMRGAAEDSLSLAGAFDQRATGAAGDAVWTAGPARPADPLPTAVAGATGTPRSPEALQPTPEPGKTEVPPPLSASTPRTEALPLAALPSPSPAPIPLMQPFPIYSPGLAAGGAPPDWRSALQAVEAVDFPNMEGVKRLMAFLGADDSAERPFSLYAVVGGGLYLAEAVGGGSLSEQKIYRGILSNLQDDPMFVPADAAREAAGWPVLLASVNGEAKAACVAGEGWLLMPVAVFLRAGEQGLATLPAARYAQLKDELRQEAEQALQGPASDQVKRCREIIDKDLRLDPDKALYTVIRAEPYVTGPGWEYLSAGYHLTVVQNSDGSQYILTVDLLKGRLIGVAEEGAEPLLKTHARLVGWALEGPDDLQLQSVAEQAMSMLEGLAGIPFRQQEGQWERTVVLGSEPGSPSAYDIQLQPVDAVADMMDPQGKVFESFALQLREDFQLQGFNRYPGMIAGSAYRGAAFGSGEGDLLNMYEVEVRARLWGGDAAVGRVRDAVEKRDTLVNGAIAAASQGPLHFRVLSIDSVGISSLEPSNGAPPFYDVTLNAVVEESSGARYQAEVKVGDGLEPSLRSLYLQSPAPEN